jgi:hypothetical protein
LEWKTTLAAVATTLAAATASAQSPSDTTQRAAHTFAGSIPHVEGDVKVDGVLDEAIWAKALVVELPFETSPRENVTADVETHAYLVENGSYLLVAFDARDPDPESIRAYLRDNDTAWSDDFVGIVLDTFNDERRAFEFFANPLGVQMDAIQDDVNRSENDAWNAIWDSGGRITKDGYVVEMKIPFSQLRFPRAAGDQTWGIDLLRMWPRNSRTRIANNPQDRNRSCYVCQFGEFQGFANAEPGKALEIVPSLVSTRVDTRPATADGAYTNGDFDTELGVGLRWGITPDVTADLAINPDFSQVEADVAQLEENTQFALFYPETRPFFLEGADYFDSPLDIVFTRTVADPDVGAKLTGRSGLNTFGSFVTKDAVTNLLFPGPLGSRSDSLDQSNDGFVGRYTRGFGDASTVGLLVTHRAGDGGYLNDVGGVDGRYRMNDRQTLRFQFLQSRTRYPAEVAAEFQQPTDEFEGNAMRLEYRYQSRNWFAQYFYQDLDPEFRADYGFVSRVDLKRHNLEANHIWLPTGKRWWTSLRAGIDWDHSETQDGELLERSAQPFFSFDGPLQSYLQVNIGPHDEFWDGQVFKMNNMLVYGQTRPRSGVTVFFNGTWGEQIDYANSRVADQHRIQPQIEWNATRHLLVRLRYTSDRLSSKTGPTVFKAELTDVRLTWQFNVRSFVRLTLQGQDTKRDVQQYLSRTTDPSASSSAAQLLYSYKINPQTVFFAGYSNSMLEDNATGHLEPTGRTLFFKVSYAWTP